MNELMSDQIEQETEQPARGKRPAGVAAVRLSPGGYFAAAALLTFVSLVCLRTERDFVALLLITITWTIIPVLVVSDRLIFNGITLWRTGLFAWTCRLVGRPLMSFDVSDIQRVEVTSMRTLRRGGNVRYRYRVEVTANGSTVVFASGSARFLRMVHALLPRLPDQKLDARACELRDYLTDPRAVRAEAARLQIAPPDVLENATAAAEKQIEKRRRDHRATESANELERAALLRRAANDLRIAGRLRQSAEAFRRALLITPQDGRLIYEYARLLKSQASTFGEARLLGRACAALRLAATRGPRDVRLLERVGETFLEYCDPRRAAGIFRRVLELDENSYRAQLGLAEVALAEGKLAHVIYHYNEAARVATDKATATLAGRESDYYSRLNDDDEYLAAELRRMNWLEGAGRIQRLTARISFAAILIALVGSSVDQVVAGIGWALASSSIIGWSGALVIRKFLAGRGRIEPSDA